MLQLYVNLFKSPGLTSKFLQQGEVVRCGGTAVLPAQGKKSGRSTRSRSLQRGKSGWAVLNPFFKVGAGMRQELYSTQHL